MRLARPLSKGGTQNKELERRPWGQGLATLSEDPSSVSSTPHPLWLQLCPLLVSMGTALTCTITHIHRSMHINEKMIKQITIAAHFTGSSCHLTRSPYKVKQILYHVFSADWTLGIQWQAKVGRLPEASWEGLGYYHLCSATPFRVRHLLRSCPTPLHWLTALYYIWKKIPHKMFYEISNWPPKIKSSDCQMFLCVSAWESGVGREERKECILRKTNWLETGRQSKQPQTSRSQQGLFKQREFIIQWGKSLLTGFTKPHLNRRLSVKSQRPLLSVSPLDKSLLLPLPNTFLKKVWQEVQPYHAFALSGICGSSASRGWEPTGSILRKR